MHGLNYENCSLVSVFVESVLWGIFLASYLIALYFLFEKRSQIVKNIPWIFFVTAMLVLSTMHVSVGFKRALKGFVLEPNPLAYLEKMTVKDARFKSSVQVVQFFLADLLIVSRTFLLWDKNYMIIVLPCLLVVGTFATGVVSLVDNNAMSFHDLEAQFQPWRIAMLALTLATKAVCLFLVAFRVRQIHASITSNIDRHVAVYTLILVIVESGATALLLCITLLPMYIAGRNEYYIVMNALSPVVGITSITIIACMTANFTKPAASSWFQRRSMQVPNRFGVPSLPRPSAPSHVVWTDLPDEGEPSSHKTGEETSSNSSDSVNKSTGTLNMAIVL